MVRFNTSTLKLSSSRLRIMAESQLTGNKFVDTENLTHGVTSTAIVSTGINGSTTTTPSETKKKFDKQLSSIGSGISIDHIIKILIVGNAKCGKSSIIGQYISKSFDGKYKSTVGAEFARKDILLELPNTNKIGVRLQLWDIAGQDRFQKLTRAYFSKAKGVVIVCDVSREGTVDAVKNWKKEIDTWATNSGTVNIPIVLFANKADLLKDPLDAFKTGAVMERVCREQGIYGWWTTSALTGESIHEGFFTLLQRIMELEFADAFKDNGNPILPDQGQRGRSLIRLSNSPPLRKVNGSEESTEPGSGQQCF